MKKLILMGALTASAVTYGQTYVTDAETRVSYSVEKLIAYEGGTGFVLNAEAAVATDPAIVRFLDGSGTAPDGMRIITGPAERISNGPYGEQGQGVKVCHSTNNWPCMIIWGPTRNIN